MMGLWSCDQIGVRSCDQFNLIGVRSCDQLKLTGVKVM